MRLQLSVTLFGFLAECPSKKTVFNQGIFGWAAGEGQHGRTSLRHLIWTWLKGPRHEFVRIFVNPRLVFNRTDRSTSLVYLVQVYSSICSSAIRLVMYCTLAIFDVHFQAWICLYVLAPITALSICLPDSVDRDRSTKLWKSQLSNTCSIFLNVFSLWHLHLSLSLSLTHLCDGLPAATLFSINRYKSYIYIYIYMYIHTITYICIVC